MLIAGNWKMNTDRQRAVSLARDVLEHVGDSDSDVLVAICPPFVNLEAVSSVVSGSAVRLGAQNVHHAESGAFTGEVSPEMLLDLGCSYVVLGHSERRQIFGESDELIGKKVAASLKAGLIPIFCIGETLDERNGGRLESVLTRQVEAGLADVGVDDLHKVVVAYEPVWAIGTGVVATPEQAQDAHKFVRTLLAKKNAQAAEKMNILYGGSVKPDNCFELMSQPDIDGALVGGASLKVDSLIELHKECTRAMR